MTAETELPQAQPEKARPLTRAEKEREELEQRLATLKTLRGSTGDIVGYIYRKGAYGKRTACPKLYRFVEDDEFGQIYGPGDFDCMYNATLSDGTELVKHVTYNIGDEFYPLHLDYCKANRIRPTAQDPANISAPSSALTLSSLLEKEKVEGLAALVGVFSSLFKRHDSSRDIIELMKVFAQQQKAPAFQDQIISQLLTRSLEVQQPQRRQNSGLSELREQISFLGELKEVISGDTQPPAVIEKQSNENTEGGYMDMMLKMAMAALPGILERFQGNAAAAAASMKTNPVVAPYLADEKRRNEFYQMVKEKHGKDQADEMARGFGFVPPVERAAAPGGNFKVL